MKIQSSGRRGLGAVLSLIALAACGSDSGDGEGGSIEIALSTNAISIEQGQQASITATIQRTDYTGTITITTEGAPSGVTAAVSNVSTSGSTTTGTVTIAVGPAVPAETYHLKVK